MNLQADMALQPDVVSAVVLIVQMSLAVIVRYCHAIDSCFDPCAPAKNPDVIPCIFLVCVYSCPAFGCVFRPGHTGLSGNRTDPYLSFARFVVNEPAAPRCRRIDTHLRPIEPAGVAIVPAADLYAAVTL